MEKWKSISGYEGYYEVSNLGRVRRVATGGSENPKLLHPSVGGSGYLTVRLSKDNVKKNHMVHRLVACAFIKRPDEESMQVAHNDGDRLNNFADNLRWATPRENNFDKYEHGTASYSNGRRYGVLSDEDVIAIRLDPRPYSQVAADFRVSDAMVGVIKRKESYAYVAPHIDGVRDKKRQRKNLPDDVVRSIRKDTRNNQTIADEIGVNRSIIWNIKNRNIYKQVKDD